MTSGAGTTRRIFGIETEYGIVCHTPDGVGLSADEVARYLFRKVVSWGRSSNVFLANGSRLYLDVGSHPEYATAECDDVRQLLAYDQAGVLVLRDLVASAQQRLIEDGQAGTIHLLRNNTDSAGNSFGCHENYLVRRRGDFVKLQDVLVPFLITRQLLTGAGKVLATPRGTTYCLSQRADHVWEAVSSATTRSRPIINTRDEPHADAELYRRLHVIVGDTSMAEPSGLLKVGMVDILLRLIEAGRSPRDMSLENPIRSIRDISRDITGRAILRLADGREMTALEVQDAYWEFARAHLGEVGEIGEVDRLVLDLWRRGLDALTDGDLTPVERELDWVIKLRLIERARARHDLRLSDPRIQRLDLAYHDLDPRTSLYYRLAERGAVRRITTDAEVERASSVPPATTRAALRGRFVAAAQAARRDYTVDWVHLKVNDGTGRTVICKDPFAASDERVDRLIESLR